MKNLLAKFGKILNFLSKNISRIKTIGTIILVLLFVLSLGNGGCQKNKAVELARQLTGLDLRNSILLTNIGKKDSIIILNQAEIDSLSVVINDLKDKAKVLKVRGDILQGNLTEIKDSLMNVPTDSSYAFLQAVYPYPGEFKYPFNEPQVRNIHLDYLENKSLWGLNENLMDQVDNCKDILAVKDNRFAKYTGQVNVLKSQKTDQGNIIKNKDKEIDLLKGEKKKEYRGKKFWKITSGILAGIAVALAL